MKLITNLNADLGIKKEFITYIHRGRNKYLNEFFLKCCANDFNYDFRGLKRFKYLNSTANFIKSLITALEVNGKDVYIFEGGLHIIIAVIIKLIYKPKILILNIADPTLFRLNNDITAILKFKIKLYLIKITFNKILTNSPIVYNVIKNEFNLDVYLYNLKIFKNKIEHIKYVNQNKRDKNVLYLISRPKETGYVKGLHIFKKIAERMNAKDKEIQFIIAGLGVEDLSFNSPNIQKNSHFEDVGLAFMRAKVLICPSLFDSYPSVTIECLEYGVLPLVSSGTGSFSDLRRIDENYCIENNNDIDEWEKKITLLLNYSNIMMQENYFKTTQFINNNFVQLNEKH